MSPDRTAPTTLRPSLAQRSAAPAAAMPDGFAALLGAVDTPAPAARPERRDPSTGTQPPRRERGGGHDERPAAATDPVVAAQPAPVEAPAPVAPVAPALADPLLPIVVTAPAPPAAAPADSVPVAETAPAAAAPAPLPGVAASVPVAVSAPVAAAPAAPAGAPAPAPVAPAPAVATPEATVPAAEAPAAALPLQDAAPAAALPLPDAPAADAVPAEPAAAPDAAEPPAPAAAPSTANAGGPASGGAGEHGAPRERAAAAAPAEAPAPAPTAAPQSQPAQAASAPAPVANLSFAAQRATPLHQAPRAVAQVIQVAQERDISHARLNLRPAELGGIEIRLQSSAAGVTAQVIADSPEAAKLLQQAADDLRRSLERQDVTLLALDVSTAGDGRPDGSAGTSADLAGDRARHLAAFGRTPEDADADEAPAVVETVEIADGLHIDVLA